MWCPKICLQGLPKNQARYLLKTVLWLRTTLLKYADPLKTSLSQEHCRWGKQHIRGVFMRWWWWCGPLIPSLCSSPDILEDNSYLTWLLVSINPKKGCEGFFMEVTTLPLQPTISTCQSLRNYNLPFHWDLSMASYKSYSAKHIRPLLCKVCLACQGTLQFETLDFQVIDSAHKLTDHMQQLIIREKAFHEDTTKVRLCFDQRKTFNQTMIISCYQIPQ